mgnify:CR=1 FL=1
MSCNSGIDGFHGRHGSVELLTLERSHAVNNRSVEALQ